MSLLCALFGHKANENPWDGSGYVCDIRGGSVDGINREHVQLQLRCPRCGEEYIAAMLHLNATTQVPFDRERYVKKEKDNDDAT